MATGWGSTSKDLNAIINDERVVALWIDKVEVSLVVTLAQGVVHSTTGASLMDAAVAMMIWLNSVHPLPSMDERRRAGARKGHEASAASKAKHCSAIGSKYTEEKA